LPPGNSVRRRVPADGLHETPNPEVSLF